MKKSLAILLLVSLTVPFLGTYLYLQYNSYKIKKEIAGLILTGLDEKDIIVLKFTIKETETELIWEHAGEFEYNGQMYDIVKKHQVGDTTWYNCYNDEKETRLNNEIDRIVARTMGQDPCQKSQTEKLTDFFKTLFQPLNEAWKASNPFTPAPNFSFFIFRYSSLSLSPPSPPPKKG